MKKYVLHRFLQLIPILLGITFLSFAMMRLAGSDVVTEMYQNRSISGNYRCEKSRTWTGPAIPDTVWQMAWRNADRGYGRKLYDRETGVSYFSFQTSGNLASDSFIHYPYHTGVDSFWYTCSGYA